jgi:hypothetical protein
MSARSLLYGFATLLVGIRTLSFVIYPVWCRCWDAGMEELSGCVLIGNLPQLDGGDSTREAIRDGNLAWLHASR